MKVLIFKGLGEVSKRDAVLNLKKQYKPEDLIILDGKQTDLAKIKDALTLNSLFSEGDRLIIVENPLESLDLTKIQLEGNLLLVCQNLKVESSLYKSAIKLGAKITSFDGEKEISVFPFLDSLIERKKVAIIELQKLLYEYGGIYVLSMIYYLLRRNLLPLPNSSFMSKKIKKQKGDFLIGDWRSLYKETLSTEFKIKSGAIKEDMGLELLVIKFIER